MKRRIVFILTLAWMTFIPCMAQKNFSINSLFDGSYRNKKNATETLVKGSRLDEYGLDIYHSLVVTDSEADATKIERLVLKDGSRARRKEQTFRKGQLYYGFYIFSKSEYNYYIFYLNKLLNGGNSVTLIYMEGEATPSQIERMLK